MHLDDEQVQRFLHDELESRTAVAVHGHLAACAACQERVVDAEREEAEVAALLLQLDHTLPSVNPSAVVARARRRRLGYGSWAAGLALALGAAAAYAVPGSPVPAWVESVKSWITGTGPPASGHDAGGRPEAAELPVTGIAVPPGENLAILFSSAQTEGQLSISLSDRVEVEVRALNGAVTFTSDVDRVVVDNRDALASFEIEVPRNAARVDIHVGDRRVFLKEGSRISTGASIDARGRYVIPLK